ncbi:hypothetical protein [Lederbergia lenta]|uniref:hypothetical protein n=1 Tax=Lederbergia lenta TaxID=1467 RepID=UPI00203ECD50|nr:hypothetical protein [Lederbergia lenta]MCM3110636.1 hypothetical protein [Lederbergia lenta]
MSNKRKDNDLPNNVFPVTKMVKIPLYSTIDRVDGKLVGEIIDYIDTPIEWLQDDLTKKEH